MSSVAAPLRSIMTALAESRRRRADAHAHAICPVDALEFTPLYTEGRCPLCGWIPEGYVYARSPLSRYERYWGAMGAIAVISLVMLLVVVFALTNS